MRKFIIAFLLLFFVAGCVPATKPKEVKKEASKVVVKYITSPDIELRVKILELDSEILKLKAKVEKLEGEEEAEKEFILKHLVPIITKIIEEIEKIKKLIQC